MNTAGAILIGLSGLTGVSAGAHLSAITAGTGTGAPYPVFASQFTVVVEEPCFTATPSIVKIASLPQTKSVQKSQTARDAKNVFVFTEDERAAVEVASSEVFLFESSESISTEDDLGEVVIFNRVKGN